MSQAITNTPGLPSGDISFPSKSIWAVVIAGFAIASVLGYGSALVATGHIPWIEHQAETLLAAETTPATQSALHPFELRTAPATIGTATGSIVLHSALSRFEMQPATATTQAAAVSIVEHSALNPFETQPASPTTAAATGSPAASSSGTSNPPPAFE